MTTGNGATIQQGAKTSTGIERDGRRAASDEAVLVVPAPVVEERVPDPVPTWDEVAERYGQTIYNMAYRLTGNPDDAKDLAQDVFVRVYRNLDKYKPGTFEGWLYRITKNLFLDKVRKKSRVRLEVLPDEDWREPEEPGPGPEQRLEQGLLRGDIEEAILELPPTFRTAVVMCDVQGMTYEEIADATGWPLGTVRSRIHRGRKLLRAALTPDGPSEAELDRRAEAARVLEDEDRRVRGRGRLRRVQRAAGSVRPRPTPALGER